MESLDLPSWVTNEIDFQLIFGNLALLLLAFVFALPVAWNREMSTRSAGLRTFPIVSIAACGYMLIGLSIFEGDDAVARVTYGIVTGIGFVGGGAILRSKGNVMGTATAASIWNTGAIGVSVAFRLFEIAFILSLINFVILRFASPLKREENKPKGTKSDVGLNEEE